MAPGTRRGSCSGLSPGPSTRQARFGPIPGQLLYLEEAEPENVAEAVYLFDVTGDLSYLLAGGVTLDRFATFSCYGDPTVRFPKVGRTVEPGEALDISGAVTPFGVLWDREIVDRARRVVVLPYGEKWLVRSSTAMSCGVLEWAREQLPGCTFEEFDSMVWATPARARTWLADRRKAEVLGSPVRAQLDT